MRVICLSDTHGRHEELVVPEGDLLIHAGDLTMRGTEKEVARSASWLDSLPHRHKVLVAGNHDWLFQTDPDRARGLVKGLTYLEDASARIEGFTVWGSPWQPWFFDWAFNIRRGPLIRQKWDLIPDGTDILVTHGPPRGVLDRVGRLLPRLVSEVTGQGEHVGCDDLLAAVARVRPQLHVFGHIHEAHGRETRQGTLFVNASTCDAGYRPVQPPVVVELEKPRGRGAPGRKRPRT